MPGTNTKPVNVVWKECQASHLGPPGSRPELVRLLGENYHVAGWNEPVERGGRIGC